MKSRSTPLRIAFGNKAGVGKDTAADYLISRRGGVKISHAAPLYDILHFAQKTAGFEQSKDRGFLQHIGGWGRAQNSQVWVECLTRKVESLALAGENIYVTDVRHRNEFENLQSQNFLMVKITRRKIDENRFDSASQTRHVSEVELDAEDIQWDLVIENDGDLEEFFQELDRVTKGYFGLDGQK